MGKKGAFSKGEIRCRPVKGKPGRWQLDWRDPETGRRIQKRVRASSAALAKKIAKAAELEVAAGRGFLGSNGNKHDPTVDQAMAEAIQASKGNETTKRVYCTIANRFGRWLNENRPGICKWSAVTPKLIRDYVDSFRSDLANDSRKKYMVPIQMTARYMSATYPDDFANVAAGIGCGEVRESRIKRLERERAKVLDIEVLRTLLDWLRANRPTWYRVAVCQALAGMRALEACNLREQDIDFAEGTVTIDETEFHRPKTESSERTIPVPRAVLEALRDQIDSLEVRRHDGHLFVSRYTDRPWDSNGYSRAMRAAIQACWQETGIEALRSYRPRWLRSTFATLIRQARVDDRVLKAYLGHSRRDVLGDHYEVVGIEWMRTEVVFAAETLQKREQPMAESAV